MAVSYESKTQASAEPVLDYDAIIIGAGRPLTLQLLPPRPEGGPSGRAGDGAGDKAADLENAAVGRGRPDAEKPRFLRPHCRSQQCRRKQTGADQAPPTLPNQPRLTSARLMSATTPCFTADSNPARALV